MDLQEKEYKDLYKKTIRKIAYFSILIIILILSKHLITQHLFSQQEKSSQIINMAGRQRMLSQAIVKDTLFISRQRSPRELEFYSQELKEFLPRLKEEHKLLIELKNTKIVDHYFEDVEVNYSNIIDSAGRILLLLEESDPDYTAILAETDLIRRNEATFLKNINYIVEEYEEDARKAIGSILLFDNILLFLITILIILIILKGMKPLKINFENSLSEIQESNESIRNIFDTIAAPVFLIDQEGHLVLSNKEAGCLLKIRNPEQKIKINDAVKWLDINIDIFLEAVKNSKAPKTIEGRLEDASGQENYITLTGISGRYGGQDGILLTMKNFTQQKMAEEKIREIAIKDGLTGLHNRSYLDMVINDEIEKAERYELPISLFILDIDHFKRINDKWGHPVGDTVLQLLAEIITENSRASDYKFRIGGEEFMVILPHTGIEGAREAAEKMRQEIENAFHPLVGKFTASFGVADRKKGQTYHQLYQKADAALYKAKEAGRNRVEVSEADNLKTTSLYWKDAWNSGDEVLDSQHKEIFVNSSKLQEEYIVSLPKNEALEYIDKILKSIEEHFIYEEDLLEKIGYEELYQHRNIHAYLLKKVYDLRQELAEGLFVPSTAFNFIFDRVVLGHILQEDIKFFASLKAWKENQTNTEGE